MGIFILVVWLPIYLLLCKLSKQAAIKVLTSAGKSGIKSFHVALGITFSGLLTSFLVWFASEQGSNEIEAFLMMIGVTLLVPSLLALFFSESIRSSNITHSARRLGFVTGIYYSVNAAPWFVLVVYASFDYVVNSS